MAWQKNGTPDTLSGTADEMTISDLTAKKFNVFLSHRITSGATDNHWEFNNNANTVYAIRSSINGGADGTLASQTHYSLDGGPNSSDSFTLLYTCVIVGEEKLSISFVIFASAVGAATAPDRQEAVLKFVPSPDADITRVDVVNTGAGDFAADSNLSALGTD